jgi:hypothetical protein
MMRQGRPEQANELHLRLPRLQIGKAAKGFRLGNAPDSKKKNARFYETKRKQI